MFENVKTNLRKLKWVILDDGNRLLLQSFLLQIFQLHLEPQLGLEDVCGLALHLKKKKVREKFNIGQGPLTLYLFFFSPILLRYVSF